MNSRIPSAFIRYFINSLGHPTSIIYPSIIHPSIIYPSIHLLRTNSFMDCFFSDVCTKYQEAAKIVNLALQGLIGQCLPGAKIIDLCEFGHTVVTAQAQKLFTKKVDGQAIDRGIAFPVCVSVNDIVCNHSPLATEELVRHYMLLCTGCWLGLFVMDCWNVSERK